MNSILAKTLKTCGAVLILFLARQAIADVTLFPNEPGSSRSVSVTETGGYGVPCRRSALYVGFFTDSDPGSDEVIDVTRTTDGGSARQYSVVTSRPDGVTHFVFDGTASGRPDLNFRSGATCLIPNTADQATSVLRLEFEVDVPSFYVKTAFGSRLPDVTGIPLVDRGCDEVNTTGNVYWTSIVSDTALGIQDPTLRRQRGSICDPGAVSEPFEFGLLLPGIRYQFWAVVVSRGLVGLWPNSEIQVSLFSTLSVIPLGGAGGGS